MMPTRVFICDDEDGMLRYLRKTVSALGYEVAPFGSPLALLAALKKEEDDEGAMVLLDIRMPEMEGIAVLRRIREQRPDLGVVMMTGYGTIESAVEAIKLGAFDYLTKPFPEERLATVLERCRERQGLLAENRALKKDLHDRIAPAGIIYRSRQFGAVVDLARRVAANNVNVLLLGESGTGKELIASAIHFASPRAGQRFLALNCAAITETLLESQLFGHLRGAFTGATQNHKGLLEEADGGTLFLDEIGDLSPALQAKLLRVLQDGEFIPVGATRAKRVDVRFIAATNKHLEQEVARGAFREDLFYRLNVFGLQLPPLRDRPDDVEPLALHFLARASRRVGRSFQGIAPGALAALRNYAWPGNVRELQNVIERGAILAQSEHLTVDDLPLKLNRAPELEQIADRGDGPLTLRDAEKLQVARILRRTGWNKSRAARVLDITRRTLDRKIVEYALSPEDSPS